MIKRYRQLRNLYKLNETLGKGGLTSHKSHELGRTHDLVDDAQKLHASIYLSRGYVSEEDVDETGRLHKLSDSHQEHSHYFVVTVEENGVENVVATARQIESVEPLGMNSFPIIKRSKIYQRSLFEIMGQTPESCIEISGLAKKRGTNSAAVLLLYREMWYRSLRDGHTLWLMACDVVLYEKLIILFEGAIQKIGSRTSYQGGDVIPAMIRPLEVLDSLISATKSSHYQKRVFRRKLLSFLLTDYPKHLLDPTQKNELKKLRINYE